MSIVAIRAALETKLNALTPAISTAWENVIFTPVNGVPYQKVDLMIADNKDLVVSDSSFLVVGFMQVLLVYPIGSGVKSSTIRADLICNHFKRGLQLTNGGYIVEVNKSPRVSPAYIDGAYYKMPITISFKCFISL